MVLILMAGFGLSYPVGMKSIRSRTSGLSSWNSSSGYGLQQKVSHSDIYCRNQMNFSLPGLSSWTFRLVIIGQKVVLEAFSDDNCFSTVITPQTCRVRTGYSLVDRPQCALVNGYR